MTGDIRRLILTAGAAVSLLLVGCKDQSASEQDETSQALNESCNVLQQVHVRGTAPAPPEISEAAYKKTINILKPNLRKGLAGQQAATNSLLARVHAGLTDLRAYEIMDMERRVLNLSERIRVAVGGVVDLRQGADLLSRYDPTAERKLIAEQRSAVNEELADLRGEQRQLTAKIEELNQTIEREKARFQKLRLQADDLRSQAQQAYGAERRFNLVQQANAVKREGDQHERIMSDAAAQVDILKPSLEQVDNRIERAEKYLQVLREADQNVDSRVEEQKNAASERDSIATDLIDQVEGLYKELSSIVDGDLGQSYQQARTEIEAAISAAKTAKSKASRDMRDAAATDLSRYQQSLGNLLWQQARGIEMHLGALTLMQDLEDLPQHEAVVANISRLTALRDDILKQATQAYSDAIDTLDGVRGDSELQNSVVALRSELWKIRSVVSNGEFPPVDTEAVPEENTDQAQAADSGSATATTAGSPLETLFAFFDAAGNKDYSALADLVYTDSPDAQRVLDLSVDFMNRLNDLDQACQSAFGMGFQECWQDYKSRHANVSQMQDMAITQMTQGMGDISNGKFTIVPAEGRSPDDFSVTVNGDKATVIYKPDGSQIQMIRVNQAWFIYQEIDPAALTMMKPLIEQISKQAQRFSRIANQVESGQISSVDDMMDAIFAP